MGLKIHLSLLSGFMYITCLSVDGSMYFFSQCWQTNGVALTNSASRRLRSAQIDYLLCYMVIKQAFENETKGIYLQTQPK